MPYTILLTADKHVPFQLDKIAKSLNSISKEVRFESAAGANLAPGMVHFPDTLMHYKKLLDSCDESFDLAIHFTLLQYSDNYFYHNYQGKYQIVSMFGWTDLTNLAYENGAFGFVGNALRDFIDGEYRHYENTGCLYDFLGNKSGIDSCLRNAAVCPECLKRISGLTLSSKKKKMIEDLKAICNSLGAASKWNQNVLDHIKTLKSNVTNKVKKLDKGSLRISKVKGEFQILIASPGDTTSEREILLYQLERKFRDEGHEATHGRLIVRGWESIASQTGYPQDIINYQLLSQVDIVFAIFKHKLGTPTINKTTGKKRAQSGTVEELYTALENGQLENSPLGMAYFCATPPAMPFDVVDFDKHVAEWKKLKKFQETLNNKILYKRYASSQDLLALACSDIRQNIETHFKRPAIKKGTRRA